MKLSWSIATYVTTRAERHSRRDGRTDELPWQCCTLRSIAR